MWKVGLWICLGAVWGLTACQQQAYLAEINFDNTCWDIRDSLQFQHSLSSPIDSQQLKIELNFLEDYAYRNVYLKLMIISPSGKPVDALLQKTMVDPQGYWMLEQKGRSYAATFQYDLSELEETGQYQFKLTQYMREEQLCQIASAAVWIE